MSFILLFTNVSYIMLTVLFFLLFNSAVFNGASAFNGDISKWDVSGVTDMSDSTSNLLLFNSETELFVCLRSVIFILGDSWN